VTKRRVLRWSLILAIVVAFAVWLEPTRVVWGWLRGEAFYQGRPTSWWRAQLVSVHFRDAWENHPLPGGDGQPVVFVRKVVEFQEPQEFVPWFATTVLRLKPRDPALIWEPVYSAPDAEHVLAELQMDPDPVIREKADHFARVRQIQKDFPITDGPVP
jgi:hypothetical protein